MARPTSSPASGARQREGFDLLSIRLPSSSSSSFNVSSRHSHEGASEHERLAASVAYRRQHPLWRSTASSLPLASTGDAYIGRYSDMIAGDRRGSNSSDWLAAGDARRSGQDYVGELQSHRGGGLRPRPSKRRMMVSPGGQTRHGINGHLAETTELARSGSASSNRLREHTLHSSRSDSRMSATSSVGGSRRVKKMKSNVEESLLEERLKVANEVLPEDNLEDLMHLPIAPELLSRRQRAREAANSSAPLFPRSKSLPFEEFGSKISSTSSLPSSLSSHGAQPPSSPSPPNVLEAYYSETAPRGFSEESAAPLSPLDSMEVGAAPAAPAAPARQTPSPPSESPPLQASTSKIPISRPGGRSNSRTQANGEVSGAPLKATRIPQRSRSGTGSGTEENSGWMSEGDAGTAGAAGKKLYDGSGLNGQGKWEVLQPAGGSKTPKRPSGGTGPINTHVKAAPAKRVTKLAVKHSPSASVNSVDGANARGRVATKPRQRAVTNNLHLAHARKASAQQRLGSNSNPTPRKGIAALSQATRRTPAGRPRSLSASSVAFDGPLPPWIADQGPRLYRVDPTGDLTSQRHDDLILPVVARRLEKQRLLDEAGPGMDGLDGLVAEWNADGTPKVVREMNPKKPLEAPSAANGAAARPPSPPALPAAWREEEARPEPKRTPPTSGTPRRGSDRIASAGFGSGAPRKEVWDQPGVTISEKPPMISMSLPPPPPAASFSEKAGRLGDDGGKHGSGCCKCAIM